MRPINLASRTLCALVASSLLAACGGGQSAGVVPGAAAPSSIDQSQNVQSAERAPSQEGIQPDGSGCKSTGKHVSVNPCIVKFDVLHLFPVAIKVKARRSAEITESDNCASQGIATVTGGDRSYTITPGLLGGSCKATFVAKNGKREYGSATADITHSLL